MSKKVLSEDGSKKIIESDMDDQLILSFTDTISANDGSNQTKVRGKGAINNAISSHLFEYLESYHILTHFILKLNEKEMTVKKAELIPLDVIISNILTGDLCKRLKQKEGIVLQSPHIDYFHINNDQKHRLVEESQILEQSIATPEELKILKRMVLKINALLKSFLERRKIKLVESRLQFGKYRGHLILTGELTPDTCRLWDSDSDEKMDRDRFLQDLGDIEENYQEIHDRIFGRE